MKDWFYKLKLYGLGRFTNFVLSEITRIIYWQKVRRSYSQKQEDLIIDRLLGNKSRGFYVDVGANDPGRFSNTKRFYDKGWSGINIEPNYSNFLKFPKQRPRDINLNVGLGARKSQVLFYEFNPSGLSTFSKQEAEHHRRVGYAQRGQRTVRVTTLTEVARKYLKGRKVDFLSVDTEGMDYEVLRGNDWKNFRPSIICVESMTLLPQVEQSKGKIGRLLLQHGYRPAYNTNLNIIYVRGNLYAPKT